jgi:DNA-directed RNA polymerase II subunit RPB3
MFSDYEYNKLADRHSFVIKDTDLAIINSVRRIILTEIPVVGFYGEEEPTVEIIINNSPLHNEFMIHRVGLIPLYISEKITDDYKDGDYVFELNVENTGSNMINITTDHFTGTYKDAKLSKADLDKIFPANNITKQKILISRLKAGEHLHLKATAIKRTAKINAAFSPVSLSNFFFMEDEKEAEKKDNILDKQRSYHKNEYGDPSKINFQIESLNGLSYKYLFKKALDIIIDKIETLNIKLTNKEIDIEEIQNCPKSFNFKIDDEDDTLGNLIQSIIHNKYIRMNSDKCSYVGYICPHPLINQLIVRFTLSSENKDDFYKFFIENLKDIIKIIEKLRTDWNNFSK